MTPMAALPIILNALPTPPTDSANDANQAIATPIANAIAVNGLLNANARIATVAVLIAPTSCGPNAINATLPTNTKLSATNFNAEARPLNKPVVCSMLLSSNAKLLPIWVKLSETVGAVLAN